MDFGHDDDYDDHVFSRGYDLDDFMQRAPSVTVYSPFGISHSSAVYSQSGGIRKCKWSTNNQLNIILKGEELGFEAHLTFYPSSFSFQNPVHWKHKVTVRFLFC